VTHAINRAIARARFVLHRRCVRMASFVCAMAAWALAASIARAQPTLVVRAESRIELDVVHDADGLFVTGALRDDLGVPLAGEDVSLELSHAVASTHQRGSHVLTRVVRATADGTFSTHFRVEASDYVVDAAYEGASEHLGTRATRFYDLDRAHVTLRLALEGGARVDLEVPTHLLTITASSDAGGAGLEMQITDEIGSADLGHGASDADGVLRVAIASDRLGPPAAGRLVVRTHGDATRAEAQSELPIVRFRATHVSLALDRDVLGAGDELVLSGTLTDGVRPLERDAISLVSGDHVLATVLTDDAGAFRTTLDESAFVDLEGIVPIVARFDGAAPWVPGSESEARTIEIRRPMAIGWLWAFVPIVIAALAVRWSMRPAPGAAPAPRRADGAAGVALGARRTIVAHRFDVTGVVRDAISGEPIAGALVRTREQEQVTTSTGAFALVATRESASLVVSHPEYLPLEVALALPHRGEHEGMQVRLGNRRAAAFASLRRVAVELAPDGEIALALTQREIFELLRSRGASPPALPELVARVEVACYADVPPDDDEIARIRASAGVVLGSPPPRPPMTGPSATRR
jgi:hypothetical protein